MIAFLVELENRPGAAADLTEAIAERGINIAGGAGLASGTTGQLALATNDDAGTRRLLLSRGDKFREIELVTVAVADRPGALARTCRALAGARVNIEALFLLAGPGGDGATVAFATDDPAKARAALGQR
jgi:hypothetical protein